MTLTGEFRRGLLCREVRSLKPYRITSLEAWVVAFPPVVRLLGYLLRPFDHPFALCLGLLDPLDVLVWRIRLGRRRDICECGMVAKVRKEWGRADQGMVVIVIGELCHREEVCPIVLSVQAEYPEVRLHPLIVILHLSLCLRVIGGQESQFDSKPFI